MRNKVLTRIIIATLLCALLVNAGRATRVSALAETYQEIAPIFDTQIIQLSDYVGQNLTGSQLDIFYMLGGAYAVAQMGAYDARLQSPYPNEESVKEWLINCGIQLYNSLIGLVPEGDYYIGMPNIGLDARVKGISRENLKGLVAVLMGNAVVAKNYPDLATFLQEEHVFLQFNNGIQLGLNGVFQLRGGYYDWQFSDSPWISDFDEVNYAYPLGGNGYNQYFNAVDTLSLPRVRFVALYPERTSRYYNVLFGFPEGEYAVFLNISDMKIYLYRNGQLFNSFTGTCAKSYYDTEIGTTTAYVSVAQGFNVSSFNSYVEAVNYYFNSQILTTSFQMFNNSYKGCLSDLNPTVYYGTSWNDKQVLPNNSDLNFADYIQQYYMQLQNNYLLDIIGLIDDLVNVTNLKSPIFDNIYDPDFNIELDPDFSLVSVDLTPVIELMDAPIPVDLNDIALYTNNDYLEEVKERSRKFGETIGDYFVFWHNSDPVTVYVIFGSFIVILVGAFIGKWGHS